MKRCYLAHYYPQCPTIPVEGSITISFWSTGLTSTRETPTLLNDGVEPMVKLIRQSWDAWNTYRPYSGAFSSPPNLQPWIVRFNMENNDTCMGVLIDSKVLIDFTKGNETKFALTTATCAKRMYLQSVNLISNSYYLGQKEHKVAVVSTYLHPQYSKGKKLAHGRREARAVYDVAIVRLATPIVFQANVQPIQLPIKPVSFESTFFIVTWNVSGSDARGPLYDVPVEINGTANFKLMMKKNQKKITTKRLFYCGNKMLDNELDGRPLVAYDRHSEDVVLAGFYSKGHENGVETHVSIHQHLPWIKETLISSELRFRKL
uniref:Peptidase S1 domain-containing protein n=1 Tax=Romanomermis culicivorax TaxID=13658 RepID=A0A915HEM2_ROMCU